MVVTDLPPCIQMLGLWTHLTRSRPPLKKPFLVVLQLANVMPGSGLLMSGQTIYVKLRPASDVQDMLMCTGEQPEICGGLKMANGTNPIGSGNSPGTRAKSAALVRGLFIEAQNYQQKLQHKKTQPKCLLEI